MKRLDRSSHTPIYLQIQDQLREVFSSPEAFGQKFTEAELAREFGVNRHTVRQALDDLVRERLVYRVKGVGVFVSRHRPIEESASVLGRFFEDWHSQGRAVTVHVRSFQRITAPDHVAASLQLKPGGEVLHIQRLRYADGIPMAIDYRYIRYPWAEVFSPENISRSTLHEILMDHFSMTLDGASYEIEADSPTSDQATDLAIPVSAPILVRRHIIYGKDQSDPIICGISYYRADQYKWTTYVHIR